MVQNPNKPKQSADEDLKNVPLPPLPFAHQIKEASKEKAKGSGEDLTVDDALKMIKDMRKMHDKINDMIYEALQATGWSPQYLKTYLDNPNNFGSTEEWQKVQQQRKELMETILTPQEIQAAEEKAKKEAKANSLLPGSSKDVKNGKERSKKFGPRRNWMPMR